MTRELPSPELLRKLLRYEPDTGKLFWFPRGQEFFKSVGDTNAWNARYANKNAFTSFDNNGYMQGGIFGRMYRAHRVIWAMQTDFWPLINIDHVNNQRHDNRWVNLRKASRSQNNSNKTSAKGSSSKYLGVSWSKQKQKWQAQISKNAKKTHLGFFPTEQDAALAYDSAAIKIHNDFANLNSAKHGGPKPALLALLDGVKE